MRSTGLSDTLHANFAMKSATCLLEVQVIRLDLWKTSYSSELFGISEWGRISEQFYPSS